MYNDRQNRITTQNRPHYDSPNNQLTHYIANFLGNVIFWAFVLIGIVLALHGLGAL